MKKNSHSLSLVIPTLNAGSEFHATLSQIRAQSHYADLEILIVDSSSTDGTPDCARQYGARVLSIQSSDFNHGDTRNLGIQESKGDFIVLMTQDAMPLGKDFLHTLVDSVVKEDAAGGFARQIPRKDASPLVRRDLESWIAGSSQRRVMTIPSFTAFFSQSPMDRYRFCVFDNVASMIRREVWNLIPFPRTPFGEDIEWAYRVLCNGYTLVYEPDAVVCHSHERSPKYVYQRTAIDHYLLYQRFGLRTVPTRRKALRGVLSTIIADSSFLLSSMAQHPKLSLQWMKNIVDVPRYAWSSAWGQYDGAKAAACGFPPPISREV